MTLTRSVSAARSFTRLRWRLLRGAIDRGGTEQVGAVLSIVASAILGVGGSLAVFVLARDDPAYVVLAAVGLAVATLGFGLVAGVSQPIDPRVIATEPLDPAQRSVGLLAAAAFGPPGLAGIAIGVGLVAGAVRTAAGAPIVVVATVAFMASLLIAARTATNLLALLVAHRPRLGQLVAGLTGLGFYGLVQFIPLIVGDLDVERRHQLADALRWTPPGQLGLAMVEASDEPGRALLHLLIGAVWIVPLAIGFDRSADRLSVVVRSSGGRRSNTTGALARTVRALCGTGPVGAIAWRSLLTRFRTPRTALETVTGAGVGLAAVLGPVVLRDQPGSGAVLVGGAVQLAVLFVAGNSFGNDGPPIAYEMLAGAGPAQLVAGKARSILIVTAPLALLGPLLAATLTGEWRYFPAGICVGIGGLLAGVGAAVVQSALVPIAVPESDNPFTSGESGRGIVAAGLLFMVLGALALATVPVGLALFWAVDRGRASLVTLFALAAVGVGFGLERLGRRLATLRLTGRDPEFVASVTPAR